MTLRKNMTKGERQAALEKRVSNLEMANRVAQMLLQQIGGSVSPMARDVGELATRQREMQYRFLAIQELLTLNTDEIAKRSEALQVKDFEETSAKEDAEKGYTVADVVGEDSVVILTTKVEGGEGGILRSKLVVKEIGFPQLRADLTGKKVGDVVEADINGTKHSITVLGVRSVPATTQEATADGAQQ
jgi:hypothetical protein